MAAMRAAFAGAGLGSEGYVSPIDGPAASLLPPAGDSGAGEGFLR
jgi:hypothetical protein